MQYKTVAFEPNAAGGNSVDIAPALENMIAIEAAQGWEYMALENHETMVPGEAGFFGIGATSSYPKSFSIAVFRK